MTLQNDPEPNVDEKFLAILIGSLAGSLVKHFALIKDMEEQNPLWL